MADDFSTMSLLCRFERSIGVEIERDSLIRRLLWSDLILSSIWFLSEVKYSLNYGGSSSDFGGSFVGMKYLFCPATSNCFFALWNFTQHIKKWFFCHVLDGLKGCFFVLILKLSFVSTSQCLVFFGFYFSYIIVIPFYMQGQYMQVHQ